MGKISISKLRELIEYDPDSGVVTWSRGHILGRGSRPKEAGSVNNEGSYAYKRIAINGRFYMLHHVIWAYTYGEWPRQIDHINRNALDNRLRNLRLATSTINSRNRGVFKNNTSGVKGVSYSKAVKRWIARISVNAQPIYLGAFKEFDDAVNARAQAEIRYGYR